MVLLRDLEVKAREEADRRARRILTSSIQRLASEVVTETTVSVVPLPSDDMKGRIIGRDGRNIRAFEAVTGVNIIVDDTPEAVACRPSTRYAGGRLPGAGFDRRRAHHPASIESVPTRRPWPRWSRACATPGSGPSSRWGSPACTPSW
jgi:hypothetical protein